MLPAEPSSWNVELPLLLLRIEMVEALASACGPVIRTMPSFLMLLLVSRYTVPLKGLLPLRISVPGPLLINPFVPVTAAPIVTVFVTTIEGDELEPVSSLSEVTPLLVIVQVWLPDVSLNFSVPMVREESSVTVRLPVILIVLKSAVWPAPVATTLPLHRGVSPQFALASDTHVPLPVIVIT